MNIRNDLRSIPPVSGDTQAYAVEKASSSASTSSITSTPSGDHASLSGAASLASHAVSLTDVRTDKVQSIQAAISSGTYNVSSIDVAQSLINHMLGN